MPETQSVNPLKAAYQHTKFAAQKAVEGVSVAVESTESFKKIFQVAKGIIELIGLFTSVGVFSPIVSAVKVIGVTVGGFDIIGRLKEWVVPDKNGQTLINKHWTKIISRIHLAFANVIDFLNMCVFFKLFTIMKLDVVASLMSKVYIFKVLFNNFPGLEVIKHPFIIFAAGWSILDSSVSIHRKRMDLNHIKAKERNWSNLANRSYERQIQFFEYRRDKYEARVKTIADELSSVTKSRQKKRLNDQLKQANAKFADFTKLVTKMKAQDLDENVRKVQEFTESKAEKWQQKVKNIKIDFAKSSISIICEIFKIFVVTTALFMSVTLVGWAFLPPMLIVLGLLSNGSSLTKFIVDKLVTGRAIRSIRPPKLA